LLILSGLDSAYDELDSSREKLYHNNQHSKDSEERQQSLKMTNRYAKTRRKNRTIACERMEILLNLSISTLKTNPTRAQHYFKRARELGMRYKIRLHPQFRLLICRNCKQLIVPGMNSRVRLQRRPEPHRVITCFECGSVRRIPLGSV